MGRPRPAPRSTPSTAFAGADPPLPIRRRARAGSPSAIDPARGAEVNRALVERGIYASGLEAGTNLETLFLDLTAEPIPPSGAPGAPSVEWPSDPGAKPKDEPTGWGGR